MVDPIIKQVDKDHYELDVKGINLGIFERSELRHLIEVIDNICLLYTSPSPRDRQKSRMPSSA